VWAGFILVLIQIGCGLFWTWQVLWFQKMQGRFWAAEDVLVSQERLILGVDNSVVWCCVWGWIKRMYKSYYLRCQTCRNFNCHWYIWQRALVFMLMWFEAYAQKDHSCDSPTPWHTWKTGLTLKFEGLHVCWAWKVYVVVYWQLVELHGSDVMSGNMLPNGATRSIQ
jgi:hypothetical protein